MTADGALTTPAGGDLAGALQALSPQAMQQIGEALEGVDWGPLAASLSALTGQASGVAGAPAGTTGPLSGAAGPGGAAFGRLDLLGALTGLSEVLDYFGGNPILGRKLGLKDAAGALGLLRSPNVQALVGTARAVPSLVRAGKQLVPVLSALRGAKGGGRSRRRGKREPSPAVAAPPLSEAAAPGGSPIAQAPVIQHFRFTRPEGPPVVLEPWRGSG